MTLEELQAEFPIGSRWRAKAHSVPYVYEVVAHHPDSGVILLDPNGRPIQRPPHLMSGQWERIPDPTPCPITEPVTLRLWQRGNDRPHWASWPGGSGTHLSRHGGVPPITLHPDGRYTWEGGPE